MIRYIAVITSFITLFALCNVRPSVTITAPSITARIGTRIGVNLITVIARFKTLLPDRDIGATVPVTTRRQNAVR